MSGGTIDFFIHPDDKKIPDKPKEPPKTEEKRVESTPLSFLYPGIDLTTRGLPTKEQPKEFDSAPFTWAHKTSTSEIRPTLPDESSIQTLTEITRNWFAKKLDSTTNPTPLTGKPDETSIPKASLSQSLQDIKTRENRDSFDMTTEE